MITEWVRYPLETISRPRSVQRNIFVTARVTDRVNQPFLPSVYSVVMFLPQLDTWFGRPKKSGRGGGVRSGSGNNTISRPHSGDDFNEIEQQRIIERMDKETVNDKFEEMLVSGSISLSGIGPRAGPRDDTSFLPNRRT